MHAFVLTNEGAAAKPMPELDIHVRVESDNLSRSLQARFDESKNHYIINGGVLAPGRYKATLLVQKEAFLAMQDIGFSVSQSKSIQTVKENEIFTLQKAKQAAIGLDLLIWLKEMDEENASFTFTDATATQFSGVLSEGATAAIAGYDIELLSIIPQGAKLRVRRAQFSSNQTLAAEAIPDSVSTIPQKKVAPCDGCRAQDGSCRLVGAHFVTGLEAVYCGIDLVPHPQKTYKQACSVNYECYDYECNNDLCVKLEEQSNWKRFVAWINSFFA